MGDDLSRKSRQRGFTENDAEPRSVPCLSSTTETESTTDTWTESHDHVSVRRSSKKVTAVPGGAGGVSDRDGYVEYDPGPDQQTLTDRYGIEFVKHGQAEKLQRLETEFGRDRVNRWVEEGMTVRMMGKPRDMQAFRERQRKRPNEIPTDVERRNEASLQRNTARSRDDESTGDTDVPGVVRDVISSPGRSLDGAVQRDMEEKIGGEFSDVRIHTGPLAATAAESINARAFTVGNHVAFGRGEYQPETDDGKRILAHELTHVRQRSAGAMSVLPKADASLVVDPDPRLEREAEEVARGITEDEPQTATQPGTETHGHQRPEADTLETQSGIRPLRERDESEKATTDMCPRCLRRYRDGKPLNCGECEPSSGGSGGLTIRRTVSETQVQRLCTGCRTRPRRGEPPERPEYEIRLYRSSESGEGSSQEETGDGWLDPVMDEIENAWTVPSWLLEDSPVCGNPDCPDKFCTPFRWEWVAREVLQRTGPPLLAAIGASVHPRVVPIWAKYLYGGEGSIQNYTDRFGTAFEESRTTRRVTNEMKEKITRDLATDPPGGSETIDINWLDGTSAFIENVLPDNEVGMNFNVVGEIPGNLAGGIGDQKCKAGAQPSPIDDDRDAQGVVDVTWNEEGDLHVDPSIEYLVLETVDLCPGNCGTWLEQRATILLSHFEATGLSGDVPYEVRFPAPMEPFDTRTTVPRPDTDDDEDPPAQPDNGETTHEVQPGDTLWDIAETYYGDGRKYPEIHDANRDLIGPNPDLIQPGWTLVIP